ncbi:MAG: nucleoside deaminase [Chitinophagales bacterium]
MSERLIARYISTLMNQLSHEYYMSIALKEATRALEKDEVPIGCIIVAQNQIVGKGYNQVERLHDVTAHAEMLAITAAETFFGNKYLKGCILYVTIEPCLMCAAAMGWSQISGLVYGAPDPKKGFTLFDPSPLNLKTYIETGILGDESGELLKEFFRKKRI